MRCLYVCMMCVCVVRGSVYAMLVCMYDVCLCGERIGICDACMYVCMPDTIFSHFVAEMKLVIKSLKPHCVVC